MLRLLCITAHPDDEAGGFGGSLRLYRERGVETHVICLTPGQAATHRGIAKNGAELATLRREEFRVSCQILGVAKGEVLDYADGGLDKENLLAVVGELTQRIRQIRPQVLMTFGPEGAITAHPDHSMTSVFATLAFHWAGRTNRFPEQLQGGDQGLRPHCVQKLYYATAGFTIPERPPVALGPTNATIEIGPYLEAKIAAFKAHTTQAPLFSFFENTVRLRGTEERFHLAATSTPCEMTLEKDLLAGVVDG